MRIQAALAGSLLAALAAIAPPAAARQSAPADILALSPEMERFIAERVPPNQTRRALVAGLMDALFGKNGLDIAYGNVETKTAVETFESRSGNCLSFTLLFVAFARHLGLTAYFQEVGEILSWDRRGGVAVSNRHMFAEVETVDGLMRVDFLPGVEKRYRSVRRIEESRVAAHYYSNLGAEALTQNELDLAEEMFGRALAVDDTLAAAWVNLGVAYRRQGRPDEAERCYLRALELDEDEVSAASNLVLLYQATGRERAAAPYVRQVRRHRRQNPFFHFRQGLDAARGGDLATAVKRLRRAVRLLPDDPMIRAELGQVYARAGKPRKAERAYLKALELTDDGPERTIVEGLLLRLRSAGEEADAGQPPLAPGRESGAQD